MKKILLNPFSRALNKYNKLKEKLEKQMTDGRFHKLSRGKQAYLISKVNRLAQRLRDWSTQYKAAVASAALISLSGFAQAQSFTPMDTPFPRALRILQNTSSFSLADIDKDNDVDLFAVYDNAVYYNKNVGGVLTPQTGSNNPFSSITNAKDIAFYDVDADNDLDAFVTIGSGIILYKNDGSQNFSTGPSNDNPLNIGSAEQLTFADIDADLDIDAVVVAGNTPYFYENSSGVFAVSSDISFSNIEDIADIAFVDADNDNDLDAFTGHKFSGIGYYENDGGTFVSATGKITGVPPGPGTVNYVDVADLDNDNKLDVVYSDPFGYFHYFNNALDFAQVPSETSLVAKGFFLAAFNPIEFTDLDDDGDQDAILRLNGSTILYLKNDGAGNFSTATTSAFANLSTANAISFADFDGDGDDDMFAGNYDAVNYYENVGGVFSENTGENPFSGVSFGFNTINTVAFADLDDDGDKDAFIPISSSGILYFENNAGVLTQITATNDNPVSAISGSGNYNIGFNDIDQDNDLDVFVAEYSSTGVVKLYLNDGTNVSGTEEVVLNPFTGISKSGYYPHITFADINGDGIDEAFFGGADITAYENSDLMSVGAKTETESGSIFSTENTVSLREMESNGTITIYNTAGSMVYNSNVKTGDSQHTIAVNATGIYLVKVMLGDRMLTKRVLLK